MKFLRGFLLGGIGVFVSFMATSQSTAETALLFSRTTPGGSARIQGMGGVQVSLGGDFSSASSNPAGLGMFNRSEASITPSFSFANATASYLGDTVKRSKSKLAIPSLAGVFHFKSNGDKWKGSSLAISLTRLNDFSSNTRYEGDNGNNSLADFFSYDSEGIDPDEFKPNGEFYNTLNELAYDNYLIEPYFDVNDQQFYYYPKGLINPDDSLEIPAVLQSEDIKTSGAQNQWSLSYGGNIDDRFFFGFGVHIRSIRFESKKKYYEDDYWFEYNPSSFTSIKNLTLEESLKITGSGVSATLGFIFRPIEGLQVGLAYNTPTIYSLKDTYNARIATEWDNFDYYGNGDPILTNEDFSIDEVISEYTLKTPGRLTGGATYFFGKVGFVSAEIDGINYRKATYTSLTDNVNYESDNSTIDGLYQTILNFRMGGEVRVKNFRFRTGFGIQGEPFDERQNDISRRIVNGSLGFGYRTTRIYADAALCFNFGKNSYRPYNVPGDFSPLVNITNQTTTFLVTVGIPF
jgi:hypothetical protein